MPSIFILTCCISGVCCFSIRVRVPISSRQLRCSFFIFPERGYVRAISVHELKSNLEIRSNVLVLWFSQTFLCVIPIFSIPLRSDECAFLLVRSSLHPFKPIIDDRLEMPLISAEPLVFNSILPRTRSSRY